MISFAIPLAFLLLPLPLLAWFLLPPMPERGAVRVPGSVLAHLERHSLTSRGPRVASPGALVLKGLGWVALVVALAGPYVQRPAIQAPTGRDVVIALDLSASMAEQDMIVAGQKTPRIDVARRQISAFLSGRKGDRIAFIGFATDAFLISPLTWDVTAVSEMLEEVTIGLPGRKTDLGQAIGLTLKVLQPQPSDERILILISDGEANAGDLAARDAALMARRAGLRIFTIGFAAENEGQSTAHLAELADVTDGRFHEATDPRLMQQAFAELEKLVPIAARENSNERRQDWRWLALLIALVSFGLVGWQEYRDP